METRLDKEGTKLFADVIVTILVPLNLKNGVGDDTQSLYYQLT